MNKWLVTSDKKWLDKWDEYVGCNSDNTILQLSHRFMSYEKYGMKWELILCLDQNENIVLGSANIIVKFSVFKLYIATYLPFYHNSVEEVLLYDKFQARAKEVGAFVSQFSIKSKEGFEDSAWNEGKFFSVITVPQYSNIISLYDTQSNSYFPEEDIIKSFSSKGRRDVRASYRKELSIKRASTLEEYKQAYSCIEQNASNKGYNVRSWEEFGTYIVRGIEKKNLFFLTAWYNDQIQGAIMLEKSNSKLSYTMGGVKRHSPDLLTGYFLQFEAIKLAVELGVKNYDISYGGPKNVQKFKSLFNPSLSEDYNSFYTIHSKFMYWLYSLLYKRFKSLIPFIIKLIKK